MFFGLLLIGLGSLFLLSQLGWIQFDIGEAFSKGWPVILIFVGLKSLLSRTKSSCFSIGAIMGSLIPLTLGLYFLGRNFDIIEIRIDEMFQYLVPLILIIIGVRLFVIPPKAKPQYHNPYTYNDPVDKIPTSDVVDPPVIEVDSTGTWNKHKAKAERHRDEKEWAIKEKYAAKKEKYWNQSEWQDQWKDFNTGKSQSRSSFIGDIHIGQDYWDLKPMDVSLFIGDTFIDLTKAHIANGETKIVISSFIGDVKIWVPHDLELGISVVSSSFIGDTVVLDRREGGLFKHMNTQSPGYEEAEKKIRLITSSFIGDVNIIRVG
jgi:lia operon protein LiaF